MTITNRTAEDLEGSGDEFTFNVKPDDDGVVKVDIPAGVTENSSKKKNLSATSITRMFDGTSPSVTLTSSADSTTAVSPFPVTAKFTEIVTGFSVNDVAVTNGTATTFFGFWH